MNPVYHGSGLWWFLCPVQKTVVGPFSTEDAAYEARSAQYSYDAIKSRLITTIELDLPIETVLE